jgi:hypothetical protein
MGSASVAWPAAAAAPQPSYRSHAIFYAQAAHDAAAYARTAYCWPLQQRGVPPRIGRDAKQQQQRAIGLLAIL